MLQLAKSLGMQPLAEGIENARGACVPASSRLPARARLPILKTLTRLGAHGAPSPRHLTTLSRSRLNASSEVLWQRLTSPVPSASDLHLSW